MKFPQSQSAYARLRFAVFARMGHVCTMKEVREVDAALFDMVSIVYGTHYPTFRNPTRHFLDLAKRHFACRQDLNFHGSHYLDAEETPARQVCGITARLIDVDTRSDFNCGSSSQKEHSGPRNLWVSSNDSSQHRIGMFSWSLTGTLPTKQKLRDHFWKGMRATYGFTFFRRTPGIESGRIGLERTQRKYWAEPDQKSIGLGRK